MKRLILSTALALLVTPAAMAKKKIVPADHMTCDQAIAYYEKYKKIYVIAHGKDIVPIYGLVPISRAGTVSCGGNGKGLVYYYVNTRDVKRCYIALTCG
jgi:hypothetical protein